MRAKHLLFLIIVFAIGVLVLPSTVSLFAGQHIWYNISAQNLGCKKCHADVYEELQNSAFHKKWGTSGAADDADCYACHRANKSITYANVGTTNVDVTLGKQAHAASTVACMLCHEANATNTSRNPGWYAGGFADPYPSGYRRVRITNTS